MQLCGRARESAALVTLCRGVAAAVISMLVVVASSALAATYKWYDEYGRIHYGERPTENALGVTNVETFECAAAACRQEQAQAREQALERHREVQQWLDERDAARERERERQREEKASQPQRVVEPVFVPVPAWPWAPRPYRSPPVRWPVPAR